MNRLKMFRVKVESDWLYFHFGFSNSHGFALVNVCSYRFRFFRNVHWLSLRENNAGIVAPKKIRQNERVDAFKSGPGSPYYFWLTLAGSDRRPERFVVGLEKNQVELKFIDGDAIVLPGIFCMRPNRFELQVSAHGVPIKQAQVRPLDREEVLAINPRTLTVTSEPPKL